MNALKKVNEALLKPEIQPLTDTIINGKEVAIGVVEAILFNKYGKGLIVSERPYEVYSTLGCWYLRGTLPKGSKGGTLEIIFSARSLCLLKLSDDK